MNTFEQQLVRAIEHGCPECGTHLARLTVNVAPARTYPSKELKLHYGTYKEVVCSQGYTLWNPTLVSGATGWTPELQEVVKGE